ncbi:hypothetical protein V8E55_005107 [Tylopilus felleus]
MFYQGDINTKVRTWLTERSSLPASTSCGPSPARTSGHDAGLSLVEGNTEPTSVIITSPLNMRCSLSEVQLSDLHVNPAARNDRGCASDINEAINAPLGAASESGDGARNSSSRPRRRTPPPPPFLRVAPSHNSRVSSVALSDSGSDSSPRSPPVRRHAPPPPQSPGRSRSPRSPTNISFISSDADLDPAMISHITNLALEAAFTPSITSQGRHRQKGSHYVSKTNCVEISDSTVEGMTINNGGSKNSGAVIHKMIPPPRSQPVPTF